jgi:hypothetical protein
MVNVGLPLPFFAGAIAALLAACSGAELQGPATSQAAAFSLSTDQTLAAIAVRPPGVQSSGMEDAALHDRHVAFGIANLLAEAFYETGKFRLVEEKRWRQHELIEDLVDLTRGSAGPHPLATELRSMGERLDIELLAFATINIPQSTAQKIRIGPLGSYQQRLRVITEVCLFVVSKQRTLCRVGEGTAQQDGLGVFYEFRDDRPDFEKNAMGRATKQGVTEAVRAVVAAIRFGPASSTP